MIRTLVKYLLLSTILLVCSCQKSDTDIITPAKQLIERQIGEGVQTIQFEAIEQVEGKDIFEVVASEGKLTLRGSSSVALCYAFHTYMKEACKSLHTWSGEHVVPMTKWPDYELYDQVSPYELRYFLNVCTFGYTTPFWDWERWEKEIDRMALYGVNMPLATVASEAIAERVWLRMGLTKEEIREFFTAPAHLPWHRMGNLNKWDGPCRMNGRKARLPCSIKYWPVCVSWACSPSHPLLQGLFLRRLRRNILIPSFVICDGEALMKNIMRMFYRPIRLSSKKSVNCLLKNGRKSLVKTPITFPTASTKWSCLLTRTIQRKI